MSEIPVSYIIEQARTETVDFIGAMDDFEYLLENGDVLSVSIPLTVGIDTEGPKGSAMRQMAGAAAEDERPLIQGLTKAGCPEAAARGVAIGPEGLLSAKKIDHAPKPIRSREHIDKAAGSLNVSRRCSEDIVLQTSFSVCGRTAV